MSHRVNTEGFRLGTSRFWNSELFSSYISNFIQKFLAVYLVLKKKLESVFFKIVFFKIVFLRAQKVLVLVNTYKIIKKVANSNRRKSSKAFSKPTPAVVLRAEVKNSPFAVFLEAKSPLPSPRQRKQAVLSGRASKGMFKVNWLNLRQLNLCVERFLSKVLFFSVELRLKNVFSRTKKDALIQKKSVSLLGLCKMLYKKTKNFWKLKRFLYLKDAINVLSLSFFYQKSGLLAHFIADIVRLRRKFFFELKNFKLLLPYFKNYYFLLFGASLKVNVLGKLFGQRKRRFRCFTLKEGLKFSTQDVRVNLSYSLAHSWNLFGSFGIKVWIYKSIVNNAARI